VTRGRNSTFIRCPLNHRFVSLSSVIYCVVPEPLADELYPKLSAYYEDDPNVEVIVDRRKSERRDASGGGGQREVRDRRRSRVTGDFPPLSAA
jgi:hypothetical protein